MFLLLLSFSDWAGHAMTNDDLRDLVERLFMCDAVTFNPIGGTDRSIAEAYWKVKGDLDLRKWRFNLHYRYN